MSFLEAGIQGNSFMSIAISDATLDRPPEVETNANLHFSALSPRNHQGHAPMPPSTAVVTKADLDLLLSLQETIRAVQKLSSGKAHESDALFAEI
ncbi:unnamed protein product [Schistocephalus solidus]|uniref:Uncharacterized protein n=1 Tax=Schistocephalus solidus TaxID=70667 RepID=A0A183TH99_SCHSO|nr:unnamed protein product [Schistocephalus solidus]